jgi:hypothetical protein
MLETLPMWSNVQPQLQPHPRHMKILKVRHPWNAEVKHIIQTTRSLMSSAGIANDSWLTRSARMAWFSKRLGRWWMW